MSQKERHGMKSLRIEFPKEAFTVSALIKAVLATYVHPSVCLQTLLATVCVGELNSIATVIAERYKWDGCLHVLMINNISD